MPTRPEDPSARTLRLLALLGARPTWPAAALAERLGVPGRTLRRDLDRLRALGYDVEGRPGPGGHYRLRPTARMPPLLLDEEQVVALVTALRMAQGRVGGDAVERLLGTLGRLLPPRLAATAGTVAAGSTSVPAPADAVVVEPDLLARVTTAAAEGRELGFGYRAREGTATRRRVDAVRSFHRAGRWYLVGFDVDRDDWRLFRLDRVDHAAGVEVGAVASADRPGAPDDLAAWLDADLGRRSRRGGTR